VNRAMSSTHPESRVPPHRRRIPTLCTRRGNAKLIILAAGVGDQGKRARPKLRPMTCRHQPTGRHRRHRRPAQEVAGLCKLRQPGELTPLNRNYPGTCDRPGHARKPHTAVRGHSGPLPGGQCWDWLDGRTRQAKPTVRSRAPPTDHRADLLTDQTGPEPPSAPRLARDAGGRRMEADRRRPRAR
jgi:hypothetical protein